MDIREIRAQMRMGRSIFDMPLRVTFYARVSTDKEEQRNSLENQVQFYTGLIGSKPNWTLVSGYIDEGISGTSTRKRDDFNRMISDAKKGLFDFIITKEISRFSRSTLDSILFTQQLLDYNVGVFFQSDNINTLDPDSEFRLVVMAGVAQDEVRKLSERLKFGFKQAIKNGHVLGNDRLYGYNKEKCILTVNEEEAEIVRKVFDMYANQKLGVRRISQALYDMGYTSREGNAFNMLTIRHMLENPKYKGWYCGNKSATLDYRTKKKVFLEEDEWIMYPDPSIPAIVDEELWDRANALYKDRSRQSMEHANGADFHSRYPYSGKIYCEEHGTTFHRQVLKSQKGDKEVWQCKVYRQRGRAACSAPQLQSKELNVIMAKIFEELMTDKETIIDALIGVLKSVPKEVDYTATKQWLESEMTQTHAKKEKLLELSMAGALDVAEFKKRNDSLNEQHKKLEIRMAEIQAEEAKTGAEILDEKAIREVLHCQLIFEGKINGNLAASILEKIVVKKGSTKDNTNLSIRLKLGDEYEAMYTQEKSSLRIIRSKNTMPRPRTKRT